MPLDCTSLKFFVCRKNLLKKLSAKVKYVCRQIQRTTTLCAAKFLSSMPLSLSRQNSGKAIAAQEIFTLKIKERVCYSLPAVVHLNKLTRG